MTEPTRRVSSHAALVAATADAAVRSIIVEADISDLPTLHLLPGQSLRAGEDRVCLRFLHGQDGLGLTTDNTVEGLDLLASADRRVLFLDTTVIDLGRLTLRNLRVAGVVFLVARDRVRRGHVEVDSLDIDAADARGFEERPHGYGVEVVPGAFTLWNQQPDPASTVTANLIGLSAGRPGMPVRGSGIFVGGAGDSGGRLVVSTLETGAVHSDGGIAPGTPDRITGGVFVVSGAYADRVINRSDVTTYGANDMVLDNWGQVACWRADSRITSHGPSAIGFVNFGILGRLVVNAPIETFAQGSRGFNVYAGTVTSAAFDRVVTHGHGAVGIQISQPIGELTVRGGIETYGGTGDSLVKGVVLQLSAVALSIKPGGSVKAMRVSGGIVTHGAGIMPLELHGSVESVEVGGGVVAHGGGFKPL